MSHTISIIPARGGSKGMPRKNVRPLAGKPLVAHSIESSLRASLVDRTIVTTDDDEIAEVARRWGGEVIMRPAELAADASPTEPCMIHAVQEIERQGHAVDLVVLLQPTTPLRPVTLIDECIRQLTRAHADSVVTVCESHCFCWTRTESGARATYDPVSRPRRQDADRRFIENGNVYVTRRDVLLHEASRLAGKVEILEMLPEDSVDIDSPFDLWLAGQILTHRATHAQGVWDLSTSG